ncbi:MAG TPA: SDR family NAD(P)-dependent oxidoreductase [Kofleriaceae bacterium]|nr:SDR family NAD(P)-dependent oxidoreductase [Kofleriaceae bacterium]
MRFAETVAGLIEDGHTVFVEMSPHPVLQPSVEELLGGSGQGGVAVGSLRRGQGERRALLEAMGALWVHGVAVAWDRQFAATGRHVALPNYAWQRERYWLEAAPAITGPAINGAAAFYNAETRVYQGKFLQDSNDVSETYLTFGLFPEVEPGYSWLRTHADPENHVEHAQLGLKAQRDLRAVLFRHVDLAACDRALDFGCGYSTDLLLLAKRHPQLRIDGFTISGEQAQIGAQRARKAGLGDRVQVFHRDSAADPFPGTYDLAFGFEVAHHIHDKQGLFGNLSAHLREGGQLVMADFISNTGCQLDHQGTTSFVITPEQWIEVLSAHGLEVTHLVDVSQEIANFLHDPDFGRNMVAFAARYGVDESIVQTFTTYDEIVQMLRRRLVSYVLFTIRKTSARSEAELRELNRRLIEAPVPYAQTVEPRSADDRPVAKQDGDELFIELAWEAAQLPAARLRAGRWLVLGGGAAGAELARALVDAGFAAIHTAAVGDVAALRELAVGAFAGQPPTAVVYLGEPGVAARGAAEPAAVPAVPAVDELAMRSCDDGLALVQALATTGLRTPPRLWLVTRGAQPVGTGDVDVTQSAVLGLGRTIGMEHPELRCARVDLDGSQPETAVAELVAELLADDGEDEVAWRGGTRLAARLTRGAPRPVQTERVERGARPYRLDNPAAGALALVLRAAERRAPGPGEVEIAVDAAAIELSDVLRALGVASSAPADGQRAAFGSGLAGRVVAVGPDVTGLAIGQEVVALADGAARSHVVVGAAWVAARPSCVTPAQAAALLVTYVGARHAVLDVAAVQPSERVLIHAAGSELGLAAVHCARQRGARVFATAITPERRAHLRALGVEQVCDAHSDAFVREVLAWTDGAGVDAVINPLSDGPLSGQYLGDRSLPILRAGGRFVELGVLDGRGVADGNDRSGRPARIARVDLAAWIRQDPAQLAQRFSEAAALVAAGELPVPAVVERPAEAADDAFAQVARAHGLGTLVLAFDQVAPEVRVADDPVFTPRADASYLITGGLGGLGLSVAGHLAERGAGHVVLVGRSGATQPAQRDAIAALTARGAQVTVIAADVADPAQLAAAFAAIAASGKPLRGVIHTAGVLDDGLLLQQTPARFRRVMAAKVQGAWNLHRLSQGAALDFFVTYASTSGVFGAPGQGNYAAANTFLDGLAHHRRAHGLAALSVDWGPFAEVGLAAAQDNRGARMAARRMRNLTPAEGLWALAKLLDSRRVQSAVLLFDLQQWLEFYPVAATLRMLSRLRDERATAERAQADQTQVVRIAAVAAHDRPALLEELLRKQVSQVIRIAETKIDPRSPLTSLGMDSLMGLELRNRIEALLGVKMAATILWTYPTVSALSAHLLQQLGLADAVEDDAAAQPGGAIAPAVDELAALDEAGVLALLDEALARDKDR